MKEYIYSFILVVIGVLVALFVFQKIYIPATSPLPNELQPIEEGKDVIILGGRTSSGVATNLIGTSAANFFVATTSATTTSSTIRLGYEADQVDLNLYVKASSSSSQLRYQLEFSNDASNWFGEDTRSVTGSEVTHQAATTTHFWTPGITEPATKNITLSDIATRYFRIKIFRGKRTVVAPGNNFSIWVQGIAKSN